MNTNPRTFSSLIVGFIAGALATVTAHEAAILLLQQHGFWVPRAPWSMEPITSGPLAQFAIPQLVSAMFWGGIWGAIFALIWGSVPRGPLTFKGIVLGLLGPALIGVMVLVPLITAKFPVFFAGELDKIGPVAAILAAYGAVTGWLYGFMTSGCRMP